MSKHTPGPKDESKYTTAWGERYCYCCTRGIAKNCGTVCGQCVKKYGFLTRGQTMEDAHEAKRKYIALHAAAPELLETLEDLVSEFTAGIDQNHYTASEMKAIAAIAKAKGE